MIVPFAYYCLWISFYVAIFIFSTLTLSYLYMRLTLRMCTCKVDLSGKTVLITGGNTGIGFETAKLLAKRGARVAIAARNVTKSQKAVQALIDATGNPKIDYKTLDLSEMSSIKKLADDFNAQYDRLDILINNAAYAESGNCKTKEGIDKMMQVNHIGPVYLTTLLLDKIVSCKPSRIIFVSSEAHLLHKFDVDDLEGNKPIGPWTKYNNTKLGNVIAAKALSKRVPEGVTVSSLSPGLTKSEMIESIPDPYRSALNFVISTCAKTPEECAQTTAHVASSPSLAGVSGQYFNDCQVSQPSSTLTDEFVELVWNKTIALIKDRTQWLNNQNKDINNNQFHHKPFRPFA